MVVAMERQDALDVAGLAEYYTQFAAGDAVIVKPGPASRPVEGMVLDVRRKTDGGFVADVAVDGGSVEEMGHRDASLTVLLEPARIVKKGAEFTL